MNTTHLLDAYAHQIAERWEIDADHPEGRPVSGRIPMGGSVGPKAGPTHLVVGDAAGSVNPFNGEGIDYAYETARMAADVIHEALVDGTEASRERRVDGRPERDGLPVHRPPGRDDEVGEGNETRRVHGSLGHDERGKGRRPE